MSFKDDKQQNIQIELDFSSVPTGEAREAGREETESSGVTNGTESPANTNRWMEEVCERENLKEALRRVKANQGASSEEFVGKLAVSALGLSEKAVKFAAGGVEGTLLLLRAVVKERATVFVNHATEELVSSLLS